MAETIRRITGPARGRKAELPDQVTETNADWKVAEQVLQSEAEAILRMREQLDPKDFSRAVDLVLGAQGQLVVTGMGKSGHIARKVAATFASTGTPAFFLHPGEALHGDLGMIHRRSVVLAFSNSGATDEILNLLPYIAQMQASLIVATAGVSSPLAKAAEVLLITPADREACPLNLAPTNSTTMQLALGDALALAVMERRGFSPDDFAMRHPLGALGRRLLVKVSDIMHAGEEIPIVSEEAPLHKAISTMTNKRLGTVIIIDESGAMTGIFCDGDLRRLFDREHGNIKGTDPISAFMTKGPKSIEPDLLGVKAVDLMETFKITVLPVCEANGKPVGLIHLHDLIQAGIAR